MAASKAPAGVNWTCFQCAKDKLEETDEADKKAGLNGDEFHYCPSGREKQVWVRNGAPMGRLRAARYD